MPTRVLSRSCIGCFQRKIKCNRLHPCTNCSKTGEDCAFPQSPIRRKRVRSDSGFNNKSNGGGAGYVTKERINDLGGSTLSGTETKDEILVVDGAGRSRLLSGNSWANIKENVILLPPERRFLLTLYLGTRRRILERQAFKANLNTNVDLSIQHLRSHFRFSIPSFPSPPDPNIRSARTLLAHLRL